MGSAINLIIGADQIPEAPTPPTPPPPTPIPGVWPLHCHILPHQLMGQAINIVVEPNKVAAPRGMPSCPSKCNYQMARWFLNTTQNTVGDNPLLAPNYYNGYTAPVTTQARSSGQPGEAEASEPITEAQKDGLSV